MAQNMIVVSVVAAFLLVLAILQNAMAIQMTVDPTEPAANVDTSVQFSCSLGSDVQRYKDVFVMDIVKDTQTQIAVIKAGGKVTYQHDHVQKRYEGKGFLPAFGGDVSKAYLNLTLLLPRVEDSGDYACVVSYLDDFGLVKQERTTISVEVQTLGSQTGLGYLTKVVTSLVRRVETLEQSNEDLNKTVDKLTKSCCTKSARKR